METLIEVKNLEFSYPGLPLFKETSLEIKKGEVFVLLGPSGSGKTTLAKLLAGLIQPKQGTVLIEGLDIFDPKVPPLKRENVFKKVGMVFQKNALFDSLNLLENITFPQKERLPERSQAERLKRAQSLLDRVGIGSFPTLFPDEISGGMQKRLGIARALALDPEILILDDPTAGLDPVTSRDIADLILELQKEKNATAFVITNDVSRATQMGDRVGLLKDESILLIGSPEEMKSSQNPAVKQFVEGLLNGPFGDYQMEVS